MALSAVLYGLAQEVVVTFSQPVDAGTLGTGSGMFVNISGTRYGLDSPTLDGPAAVRWSIAASVGATPDPDVVRYVKPTPPFGTPIESAGGVELDSFTLPWSIG